MKNNTPDQSAEFTVSAFQRTSILIICFLLYMINFMDRQVLSAVLEPMKIDLGFSDTQAGILQTAFFLKDYKTVAVTDEQGEKTGFWSTVVLLFKIPSLRWVYFGYAMHMAMVFAFAAWGAAFVMRAQGVTEAKAGMILGITALAGIIGTPIGGVIADLWQKKNRKGRTFTPILASSGAAVLLFLALILDLKGPGLALIAIYGIFAVIGIPAVNSISQDVVNPGLKGIAWGMAGVIMMIFGAAWSPSAVGIISDVLGGGAWGLKAAMMALCLLGFVACFCFWKGSSHYPEDMEKVQGFVLESEQ
ncbi:MAG: hypothetical protein JXA41_06735 [Deltaproteobacteria bacterium]|nr:hypothetical protein [Deltaproteobacteria bacterium]